MKRLVLAGVVLGACYTPKPPAGAPCSDVEPCPLEQTCFAGHCYDNDGGTPRLDAPIDAPMVFFDAPDAACMLSCIGSELLDSCGVQTQACAVGCSEVSGAHCETIVPSNGLAFADIPPPAGAGSLVVTADIHFDTDTGLVTLLGSTTTVPLPPGVSTTLVPPLVAGAPSMRVVYATNVTIQSKVLVTGSHPLAIVAVDVRVESGATMDLRGGCQTAMFDPTCGGPGAGAGAATTSTPASGCGAGQNGLANHLDGGISEAGGGGGGNGGAGGGGASTQMSGDGIAGGVCGTPTLVPLVGGSGGGLGGVNAPTTFIGGRGGGGGGALQISASNSITIAGAIIAGGAGGETGHPLTAGNGGGGGGGGAGGGVLLESLGLQITGTVEANGGGGGGNLLTTGNGSDAAAIACAAGGAAGNQDPGGAGACATTPTAGNGGSTAGDRGGGGGGLGRIRFNRVGSVSGAGTYSPAPTTSTPPLQ